jgi:PEP-CTERM motif
VTEAVGTENATKSQIEKIMKKIICATMVLGLFGVAANAQILVDDNFNRPDGPLVTTSPTPGPGGVWTNHSGTIGEMQITSGQVAVMTTSTEDANVPFGSTFTSGLLTANFDINVSAAAPIGGGDYEYFAHFSDGGTFNFYSRMDIVAPNSTGDYTLGIATAAGTAESIFPNDFSFGNTVNVTLAYDWGTGLSSVTVGGTTATSTTSLLPPAGLSAFALRESTSSGNETILVDNLVVTYVPEPSTIALGGFGLLTLLLVRRRRQG